MWPFGGVLLASLRLGGAASVSDGRAPVRFAAGRVDRREQVHRTQTSLSLPGLASR
jgi:hypothetical protein